jgi:hypothetical protein
MKAGPTIKGELLFVERDAFLVAMLSGLSDKEIREHPEYVIRYPRQDVDRIIVEPNSNVVSGMAIGLLSGLAAGMFVTVIAFGPDHHDALGDEVEENGQALAPLLLGFAGAAVGGIVGGGTSTDEKNIALETLPGLDYFQRYARYQELPRGFPVLPPS